MNKIYEGGLEMSSRFKKEYGIDIGKNDLLLTIGHKDGQHVVKSVAMLLIEEETGPSLVTVSPDEFEFIYMDFEDAYRNRKDTMLKVTTVGNIYIDSIDVKTPFSDYNRFFLDSVKLKVVRGWIVNSKRDAGETPNNIEIFEIFEENTNVLDTILENPKVFKIESVTYDELIESKIASRDEEISRFMTILAKLQANIETQSFQQEAVINNSEPRILNITPPDNIQLPGSVAGRERLNEILNKKNSTKSTTTSGQTEDSVPCTIDDTIPLTDQKLEQ